MFYIWSVNLKSFKGLSLHINYLIKTISLAENRLPCEMAEQIILKKTYWYKDFMKVS